MSDYRILATRVEQIETRKYIRLEHGEELISIAIFDSKFASDRDKFCKEHSITPVEAREVAKELIERANQVDEFNARGK